MHVMLDQDQWEVGNGLSLGDVLADISEKAHARSRLITSLTVDQRTITDRDLDSVFLGERIARFTHLKPVSKTMDEVMRGAASGAGAREVNEGGRRLLALRVVSIAQRARR